MRSFDTPAMYKKRELCPEALIVLNKIHKLWNYHHSSRASRY